MYHIRFSTRKMSGAAFTLIELLVVIAIIGVLVAVALPIFSSVQENGASVKCISNMKQIGAAMDLFVNDHNGYYPALVDPVTAVNWDSVAINPYLPERTDKGGIQRQSVLFICPDANYVGDVKSDLSRTYSATDCMTGPSGSFTTPSNRTTFASMVGTLVLFDGTQSGTLRYSQEEVTWGQVSGGNDLKGASSKTSSFIDYRHRNAFHGLFADGHVDTITRAAAPTTVTKLMWNGRTAQ